MSLRQRERRHKFLSERYRPVRRGSRNRNAVRGKASPFAHRQAAASSRDGVGVWNCPEQSFSDAIQTRERALEIGKVGSRDVGVGIVIELDRPCLGIFVRASEVERYAFPLRLRQVRSRRRAHDCCRSLQLFSQRLGLLQVGGVKALGKPTVDRRQQRPRFGPLTLLLPEATEAHGGP